MKKRNILFLSLLSLCMSFANMSSISAMDNKIIPIDNKITKEKPIQKIADPQEQISSNNAKELQKVSLFSDTPAVTRTTETVELDVSKGIIDINDTGYQIIGEGEFVPHSGSYIIIGTFIADKTIPGNNLSIHPRVIVRGGTEESPIIIKLKDVKIDNGVHNHGGYSGSNASGIKIGTYSPWVAGHAKFELVGQNTVIGNDGSAGIQITSIKESLSSLVIEGSGTLNASSTGAGAGIGSSQQSTVNAYPKITINSGTIIAKGGETGAGIGGGKACNGGEITINGGDVTAIGGRSSAGIGLGWQPALAELQPAPTKITINGGSVKANGGDYGSGIGGGYYQYDANGYGYDITTEISITISDDAIVSAKGGYGSAGIGSGSAKSTTAELSSWMTNEINISGGTIDTVGGESGAGIGTGLRTKVKEINISGGTINAQGGKFGAGIGGAVTFNSDLTGNNVNEINITNGTINSKGGQYSAGIGSGYTFGTMLSSVGTIHIQGGNIQAIGGYTGSGIGSGMSVNVNRDQLNINAIEISDGILDIQGGDYGAGIGSGASSTVGDISIDSGEVKTVGGIHGAGIGSGHTGKAGKVQLSGGAIEASSKYISSESGINGNAAAVGTGLDGLVESITISGETALYAKAAPFAAAIGRGYHRKDVENPVIPITILDNPTLEAYAVGSPLLSEADSLYTEDYMQAIDYEGVTSTNNTILMGHFKNNFKSQDAVVDDDLINDMKGFRVIDSKNKKYELSIPVLFQSFAITAQNDGIHKVLIDNELYAGSKVKTEDSLTTKLEVNKQALNAHWFLQPIDTYTVNFESNGGTLIESILAGKNEAITEPVAPTKEGHIFEGWYQDEDFTKPWNFATDKVVSDITLYAKWEKTDSIIDIYKVSFIFNDGTFENQVNPEFVVSILSDGNRLITVYPYDTFVTKEGYVFTGWYSDAECTKKWDFATDKVVGDMNLYAGWQKIITPEIPGDPSTPENKPVIDTEITPPKTSDTTTLGTYFGLMTVSLLLISIVVYKKTKERIF